MSESTAEAGGYKECVLQITGDRRARGCWGWGGGDQRGARFDSGGRVACVSRSSPACTPCLRSRCLSPRHPRAHNGCSPCFADACNLQHASAHSNARAQPGVRSLPPLASVAPTRASQPHVCPRPAGSHPRLRRVYSKLKYESGVHRVQRVPATETSGRVHTSTATVAIMPEVDDVDVKIDPKARQGGVPSPCWVMLSVTRNLRARRSPPTPGPSCRSPHPTNRTSS